MDETTEKTESEGVANAPTGVPVENTAGTTAPEATEAAKTTEGEQAADPQ